MARVMLRRVVCALVAVNCLICCTCLASSACHCTLCCRSSLRSHHSTAPTTARSHHSTHYSSAVADTVPAAGTSAVTYTDIKETGLSLGRRSVTSHRTTPTVARLPGLCVKISAQLRPTARPISHTHRVHAGLLALLGPDGGQRRRQLKPAKLIDTHKHTHTHTRPFNGTLSGTTQVSR